MNLNYENTREVVKDIIERRKTRIKPAVFDDFTKMVYSIRYIVTMNKTQLTTIWNSIRLNAELTDFVLDCTREFLIRCFSDKGEEKYSYEDLSAELSRSYDLIGSTGSCLDNEITTALYGKAANDLFLSNPWFTFLYVSDSIAATEVADG